MNAVWTIDYDYRTDKIYKAPGCPKCEEPIVKNGDIYRCFSCGRPVEVKDDDMKAWLAVREEIKTEMRDCPKINLRSGETIGCGCTHCVETRYTRNPVTLEWQPQAGKCDQCGLQYLV